MLSKKNRPNSRIAKKTFISKGFFSSNNLRINYFIGKNPKKIGFSVPKKVAPRAVDRNLLKRRGFMIIRKLINNLPEGINGVFTFKNKALTTFGGRKNKQNNPNLNLENEIKDIIRKFN